MKKRVLSSILAGVLAVSVFAGCGSKTEDNSQSAADNSTTPATEAAAEESAEAAGGTVESKGTIKVAASATPHAEILAAAKPILAEQGWDLEVTEFDDYVLPNEVVESGEMDANYFQHTPYLNNFNKENGTDLAAAFDMHYEPFGIYAGKTASIEELKDGASIAIPNDGSNETRALLLLQDAGLIKLKDGIDPTSDATKLDITENPKNLDIQEIAAEQLPRSLADVDLAVINGNYALQADLNAAEDSLITENPDYAKIYVNVVACRSGEENSDKIQALKKAMQSDDVKKYVDETYKGAVVTVF